MAVVGMARVGRGGCGKRKPDGDCGLAVGLARELSHPGVACGL